ncbi:mannose-1-phosphate guanylyltransferase [Paenibacillus tianmuensis]|uniref:Mannose-1-phosphate guanylyltransferase n=1 Tax=Paenibacillus tianmuensis TaxID=624147 RepID=A0A1G4QQR7_9BACL|nr:sugar phosphate nucleotidyltransferase [Paenibacillus tianmuensis]SCW46963.1 mannose-1-phosphate guanylyltransferase [Paenibacillus tianmuensis]
MNIIIMAGGQGTRFWPRSTRSKPKQFLALTSEETMLQQTYRRFLQYVPSTSIYVLTTKQYSDMVREQLPELKGEHILLEPEPKDTAPCIALSALHFLQKGEDDVLVTTPSDQYIPEGDSLWEALKQAESIALSGCSIVTLGIVPTRPETGYGYILTEEPTEEGRALTAKAFIEKPPSERAKQLMEQKNVFWNSGIFIWKPSTIAYFMSRNQQEMWSLLEGCGGQWDNVYSRLPKVSVDYAILEKASSIYTIPVHFEWDDIGSWSSLERVHQPDEQGNLLMGDASTLFTHNSIVYTENLKTVVIGVKDLIIVSTPDGLLVCDKAYEQHIRDAQKFM